VRNNASKLSLDENVDDFFRQKTYEQKKIEQATPNKKIFSYYSTSYREPIGFSANKNIFLNAADYFDCEDGAAGDCPEKAMDPHRLSALTTHSGSNLFRCGSVTRMNYPEFEKDFSLVIFHREAINKCEESDDCDENATCPETDGGSTCACNLGWEGDGKTCKDIDECSDADECDKNAKCTNSDGSFTCTCKSGWKGNGEVCTEIDDEEVTTNKCRMIKAECASTGFKITFDETCRDKDWSIYESQDFFATGQTTPPEKIAPACKFSKNGNGHPQMTFNEQQCQTRTEQDQSSFKFIVNIMTKADDFIFRKPIVKMSVTCEQKKYEETGVRELAFNDEKETPVVLEPIKLQNDLEFSTELERQSEQENSEEIEIGEKITINFDSNIDEERFNYRIDECWAKGSDSESAEKFYLVDDGCPEKNWISLTKTTVGFTAFSFRKSSNLFIQCNFLVCLVNDADCNVKNCKRRRRYLSTSPANTFYVVKHLRINESNPTQAHVSVEAPPMKIKNVNNDDYFRVETEKGSELVFATEEQALAVGRVILPNSHAILNRVSYSIAMLILSFWL